ncbi:flagellar hook-associated protein FlgL [Alkalicella caledoniensis]|uniref:Flagellar hook-associated protein FlgL n=1 Tax=Alkalicella caledoniensis TaxID=2731377 RepID=A0A7G9W713_ALKCA|nr:flagellar hook-associated protein FlgL [Alkalicella caledoniensis]QNO14475.1 flagellar hook-associated protein FlgL [Alkalicella caledoniensis]
MRITSRMLMKNMLNNLSKNNRRLENVSQQLSTGKRINKPSDDPGDTVRSLRIRTELNEIKQYRKNIDTAKSILQYSDDALDNVGQGMHRAMELGVQALNDTYDESQRQAIAAEINGILEDMLQGGNSTFANRYIFAGTTTNPPFVAERNDNGEITSIEFVGNNESKPFELGIGSTMDTGMNGPGIFNPVFDGLIALRNGLMSSNREDISTGYDQVKQAFDSLLVDRADLGARVNQLELTEERMASAEFNLKKLQSDVEDVDMYEAAMNLANIEALHMAGLNVTARIIQPTLIDYLR